MSFRRIIDAIRTGGLSERRAETVFHFDKDGRMYVHDVEVIPASEARILEEEVKRLRGVLEHIANQGLGSWSEGHTQDAFGSPWIHWAERAKDALK